MNSMFAIASLWFGLALIATFLAARMKISMALMEILVGIAAAAAIGHFFGKDAMGAELPWLKFLASVGAVLLTFLAGAELEPAVMRRKWKEVSLVGAVGFFGPFLGCAAVARVVLGWSPQASWLAGIALSTTSMAVVYAVMLETGLQPYRLRQGHPRSLLRERPWDRPCPGLDVRAVHLAYRWSSLPLVSWPSCSSR